MEQDILEVVMVLVDTQTQELLVETHDQMDQMDQADKPEGLLELILKAVKM